LVIERQKCLAADKLPRKSSHQNWIEEESAAKTVEIIIEEKAAARKTEARAAVKSEPRPGTHEQKPLAEGKIIDGPVTGSALCS
jgi:hypothetical protein